MENLRFLHLSWDDTQRLTEAIAEKIEVSGFNPDIIIAISRGGFSPARILCDQLGVRRLASVQLEAYDGMIKRPDPVVVLPINADLQGKKALVVDDVSDSGASLIKAKEHIAEKAASDVKVATIHIKPWSRFIPDYYAEKVEAWVVYPWEIKECILEVAHKIRVNSVYGVKVSDKLIEAGFKETDVKRYLQVKNLDL